MKKIVILFVLTYSQVLAQDCNETTHNSTLTESWLSCDISENPNTLRGDNHWIMYDFGYIYQLKETWFWNFNQNAQTNNGMKNIVIDYSIDGITWEEASSFMLSEASGTNDYEGESGPNLYGIQARYILISALDTWGGSCAGLSEVKINVDDNSPIIEINDDNTYLNISPNPALTSIRIDTDFDYNELLILSTTGTEIYRTTSKKQYIDVSYLPIGLYYLKLVNKSNKTKARNFVKKTN